MSYQRIMGLEVSDPQEYANYRAAMKSILASFGGEFTFDFIVSEALLAPANSNINRVFCLSFPSEQAMQNFFTDAQYLVVKERHFSLSVKTVTTLSMHHSES